MRMVECEYEIEISIDNIKENGFKDFEDGLYKYPIMSQNLSPEDEFHFYRNKENFTYEFIRIKDKTAIVELLEYKLENLNFDNFDYELPKINFDRLEERIELLESKIEEELNKLK